MTMTATPAPQGQKVEYFKVGEYDFKQAISPQGWPAEPTGRLSARVMVGTGRKLADDPPDWQYWVTIWQDDGHFHRENAARAAAQAALRWVDQTRPADAEDEYDAFQPYDAVEISDELIRDELDIVVNGEKWVDFGYSDYRPYVPVAVNATYSSPLADGPATAQREPEYEDLGPGRLEAGVCDAAAHIDAAIDKLVDVFKEVLWEPSDEAVALAIRLPSLAVVIAQVREAQIAVQHWTERVKGL